MKINDILNLKIHPLFNLIIDGSDISTENKLSYYKDINNLDGLSFDVSNQKVLANNSPFGRVNNLVFYQDNYLTEEKPGVWVNKNYKETNNLENSIMVDGINYKLSSNDHKISVDLIKDSIPRYSHEYEDFKVYEFPFAPILKDNTRLNMLVKNIYIVNTSEKKIEVNLNDIPLYAEKYSDQQNVLIYRKNSKQELNSNEMATYSVAFINPDAYEEKSLFINNNTDEWLLETVEYYSKKFGNLKMDKSEISHLLNRSIYQSLSSLSMNHHGEIVGSNWGSYPATKRIWNKDMFYSSLVTIYFDHELCKKIIIWFNKYGIKYPGSKFEGGIKHSLSNSLSSLILSSLYYEQTSDINFFLENSEILSKSIEILDSLKNDDSLLQDSIWISDGYSLGDYHTGSNICLWKSYEGISNILKDLEYEEKSREYNDYSQKLKEEILNKMIHKGPYGYQFLEGIGIETKDKYSLKNYEDNILEQGLIFLSDVIEEEEINLMMRDGEESDTTLIPFYGFLDLNNQIYQNTMKFAASEFNPTYRDDIKGISWGLESGATFPGFITVLMSKLENPDEFNLQVDELLSLQDIDGSWWWWPYKLGTSSGDVVRDFGCGKCGWASGVFTTVMMSQYFGISFNKNILTINPVRHSQYQWENLEISKFKIDILCDNNQITIRNKTNCKVKIKYHNEIYNLEGTKKLIIERN